jgi:hypothetical protein
VDKVEPVQVRFTLRLRDQRSMRMQNGCKSLHGFLHGIKWIMLHGHLDCFQKSPLGGSPNTKWSQEIMVLRTFTTVDLFYFIACDTSRKHCKKEPQSFSHCSSFDHPDMHSLNDCIFFFFCFAAANLIFLCAGNTPLERYFQDLSNGILKAIKFLEFMLVNQKKKNNM